MFRTRDARIVAGYGIARPPEWAAPQRFEHRVELNEGQYGGYEYGAPVEVVTVPVDNIRLLYALGRIALNPEYYENMIHEYKEFEANGPPRNAVDFEALFGG